VKSAVFWIVTLCTWERERERESPTFRRNIASVFGSRSKPIMKQAEAGIKPVLVIDPEDRGETSDCLGTTRTWLYSFEERTFNNKQNYRASNRRLSAKLVPTFAFRGCRMDSATDPHGRTGLLTIRCMKFRIFSIACLVPMAVASWSEVHRSSVVRTLGSWVRTQSGHGSIFAWFLCLCWLLYIQFTPCSGTIPIPRTLKES
jgi:hypothetical protein